MAKGKLILICQSGGEFLTNEDGTMTYNGGEANAANVTSETPFTDLKLNLAETCNFNQETVTVKYFLPGNKRNLITVKNDKDVKRMIDFHGDALTAEVFVTGTPGFTRPKIEETVNDDNTSAKNDDVAKETKVGPKKDKKVKKDRVSKTETLESDNANGSTGDTSTSVGSEHVNIKEDSDCSSDFVPQKRKKRVKNETDIISASPADSVKKRRRTPSWKFGANGRPTIVSGEASVEPKSQRKSGRLAAKEKEKKPGKKRGRPRSVKVVSSTSDDQEMDDSAPNESLLLVELNKEKEKEKLYESDKESYNKLPWFCNKILETNPGSVCKLVIGDNKRFKSLYVSFYATLSGFQNSCRPLIFLESTSFRSKYGEIILTANAIDGNDGFFPVSFAIVDVEDNDTWRWFLTQLKDSILIISQPITFVFDRDKNLNKPVLENFQDSHIGYSIYHLLESFKRTVKGPFHGDGKSFLPVHFLAAAHAVRVVGFRKSTEQIKLISQHAYDWVMQIEPQHWTTSSFQGEQYNHITDDINFQISKLMNDYQDLPILQKIDVLIRSMIDEITDAKLDATMWGTHLTPSKEKKLQEENLKSCGLKVLISSDTLFEVREDSTHVVNIATWSCTCLGWKETGLPCRHALAVFALIGKNPYEFCSNYFTVDAYRITYAESITAVPIEKEEKMEMISTGGGDENSGKIEGEKEEDEKVEVVAVEEKEEGLGSKEEWAKVEDEKEKSENVEIEKGGGENVEVEKDEGGKGNNKMSKEGEEEEVVVLPPIPVEPADVALVKEKMEWEETEVETKRTVTCTKCKQPGHNKKSCNLYQLQQEAC